jgi:ER-bound oxygenase mpaB/B'/Rubber oxygenase, catalytic domain
MPASRYLNADEARARFGPLADVYEASLTRGDPAADAAVEALHASGHGRWWDVVAAALDRGADAVPDCPPEVGALLASLPPVPSQGEQAVYEQATAAIRRTGESAGLVLTCAALMIDYWSPAFSKPLVLTGSLLDDTGHRLARTSAWWEEVHKPDGSRQDQDGFKTTVHVRLIHAWVRRMALKSGHWDSDAWGLPINQGDLFFQAVGFTWLTLRSFERMGYRLKASEQAAYYRLWRYLGATLGIDAELVALLNEGDCARFWDLWLLTNPAPDENCFKLTEATLRATAALLGSGWAQDHVYYPMLCGTARWLLDDRVADGLHIPKTYWSSLLPLTYRPAVRTTEFVESVLPYARTKAVARAVRRAVTENRVTGIMPEEGTNVVAEPERLAHLAEFAPVGPEATDPPAGGKDAPAGPTP